MTATTDNEMADYTLYSYFRSSCSARLRIALNLKGLSYKLVTVNLLKGEQKDPGYTCLNPSGSVPFLCNGEIKIGQSIAALEYLEEAHPDEKPLLPPSTSLLARARVRTLVNIIACDTQPVTNLRILNRVRGLDGDASKWAKGLMEESLEALEALVNQSHGKYCVGDHVTLADVCLVPAIWGAVRFGVDVAKYPTLSKIFNILETDPAVIAARWENQPDYR